MKNKLLFLCLIATLVSFSFLNNCFADGTQTVRGVKIITQDEDGIKSFRAERFSSYALGTSGTYIYNDAGGTSTTDGSLRVFGYELKYASINITNTAADTVTVRPETQIGTTSFWINGSTTTFVGTQSGNLEFTKAATNIRWGFIKNGTTTATVTFVEEYVRYLRQ